MNISSPRSRRALACSSQGTSEQPPDDLFSDLGPSESRKTLVDDEDDDDIGEDQYRVENKNGEQDEDGGEWQDEEENAEPPVALSFPSTSGAFSRLGTDAEVSLQLGPAPVHLCQDGVSAALHVVIHDDPTPPIIRRLVAKKELAARRRQREGTISGVFSRVLQTAASGDATEEQPDPQAKRQRP